MKLPIRLMQNKLHSTLIEHLKLAGASQPKELTALYSDHKQAVSQALVELQNAGMVMHRKHSTFPPTKVYEITDFGWNATNVFNRLTAQDITILQGKTYMSILRSLPSNPKELGERFGVTISDISHHLRLLKKEALVNYEKQGKKRLYFITKRGQDLLTANSILC